MRNTKRHIKYENMLKEAEHKERKPVDKWFLNYCKQYNSFCRKAGEGKEGGAE